MLGSEVPPCRTITFDGGQFFGSLEVPGVGVFPVAGGSAAPAPAGGPMQLAGSTRFLCPGFLLVGGRVEPEEPCPGRAAGGAAEVGSDGVDGFGAGGAAPCSCVGVVSAALLTGAD